MSFTKRVRSSDEREGPKVRQPTQRGFKLSTWDAAFSAHAATSGPDALADARLHRAGHWFHARLTTARAALTGSGLNAAPPDHLTRILVGYLNAKTAGVRGMGPLAATAELPTADGGHAPETFAPPDVNAEGMIGRLHDIARFPLREAVAALNGPGGRETTALRRKDLVEVLGAVFPIATAYEVLADLWGECVWNGWYVDEAGPVDLIAPADPAREEQRAVSNYREASLRYELAGWHLNASPGVVQHVRESIRREPHVVKIERVGRRRRLVVGPSPTPLDTPTPTELLELTAETVYLSPLLSQPLDRLGGLTVREITRGWRLLSSLASVLWRDHLPNRSHLAVAASGEALSYCPTFERAVFVESLVRHAGFSADQAQVVVDLLTFDAGTESELWLAPLVPVGDDLLAPALGPLEVPNLLRLQEHWLARGGFAMDLRGGPFEQHVRDAVAAEIELPNADIVGKSVKLNSGARAEEIDLLVRIGDTVLVGEAKCTLSPAVPVEFGRLFGLLDGAAEQVLRKVAAASADLAELRRVSGWADLPAHARLVPVIVSNLAAAAGHVFRGVPVVDEFLLARFLGEGRVSHLVDPQSDPDGRADTIFYESPDEASRVVGDYLRNPPQIDILRQFASWSTIPLLDMPGDSKSAACVHCDAVVPDVIEAPAGAVPVAASL